MDYRFKKLRLEYDLSQSQMAAYLGVTQQTYSRYEIGELEPSIDSLVKLARFYNVNIDYLLGLSDYHKNFWNDKTLHSKNADEDIIRKQHIINTPKSKRGRPLRCD